MDVFLAWNDAVIENRPFNEIEVGETASMVRTLAREDIALFAAVPDEIDPVQPDPFDAKTDPYHGVMAHGLWGGALISAVLGTKLPGPGTVYLSQDLHFRAPVNLGDTITTSVTVRAKIAETEQIIFYCRCVNQSERLVISGIAVVQAPADKIGPMRASRALLPAS